MVSRSITWKSAKMAETKASTVKSPCCKNGSRNRQSSVCPTTRGLLMGSRTSRLGHADCGFALGIVNELRPDELIQVEHGLVGLFGGYLHVGKLIGAPRF